MHTQSDNVEIIMVSETDEITEELFESLWQRYHQEELEEPMDESHYIFNSADAFYYNLNKISSSRGGSCIDSPE